MIADKKLIIWLNYRQGRLQIFFVDDVKNYSMMVEMYIEFRHLKQLCYKFIKK